MKLAIREEEKLQRSFTLAEELLERTYLHNLTKYEVSPIPAHIANITVRQNIRLFQITKIVYDKNEDVTEKLINIYNTVGSLGSSLALIIDSDGKEVQLYIGIRSGNVLSAQDGLEKSFKGNFPGTQLKNIRNSQIETLIDHLFTGDFSKEQRTVCSVTGIPAFKDVEQDQYIQGLEKLIDAMRGEKFSALFLADAVDLNGAEKTRQGYEELYTNLTPFKETTITSGQNDSFAVVKGITEGITNTINDSITKTQSFTEGKTEGSSDSVTDTKAPNILSATVKTLFGGKVSTAQGITRNYNENQSSTTGNSTTEGVSRATSNTKNSGETKTEGSSRTMQVQFENKTVSQLLTKIDEQLDRLRHAEDLGLWHYSCYFLADDEQTARVAATNYQSLIRGNNSALEGSSINVWKPGHIQKDLLMEYLSRFSHPSLSQQEGLNSQLSKVNGGTLINSRELAIAYGLPRKSVSGIPVIETAEFGRNVYRVDLQQEDRTIRLGNIYYMGQKEPTNVELNVESLAMHTFVTGSTGSGKSNTIYNLVNELDKQNVRFLIIEPAKGEYKNIFGGRPDVRVFGTNPSFAPLLKINPFRFPDAIHVLEHIDRLIEIFNACWPMYAAMPAVLREAVENVYEEAGWDLEKSIHFEPIPVYPTLKQLVIILPAVIERSAYSEEVKSNYVGSLVTRVKSLTMGLVGNIFVDQEVPNEHLFDENCIVDLSRVGSSETKSLLMGILFMRLQEHRMANSTGMNNPLRHITVLEEAHHLLRKTSVTQSDEGANLQGKSVEMLTNAISEMRTYGEGFIIADQSPNLLDPSVIRNTNTKIIMRLPDGNDRVEVGASASLNDEQLNEISKLETGVAIVYQNNWLQPVLSKIDYFGSAIPFSYSHNPKQALKEQRGKMTKVMQLLLRSRLSYKIASDAKYVEECVEFVGKSDLPAYKRFQVTYALENLLATNELIYWDEEHFNKLAQIISELIDGDRLVNYSKSSLDIVVFTEKFLRALATYVDPGNAELSLAVMQCLLYEYAMKFPSFASFYEEWCAYEMKVRETI
ncbi:ATP-binding protein [Sporosarcina luteola]|uniref:ATP-binding protein n=1 Tax=Sporosarcina luteola TaxID=582850 RepID=A0A511Z307_9BACL|nr:ATPase, T2SS/T4P/T4SS family [Sporosarcina luteola]GEN81838.1 ATP-binding protein [Sporosarcina luteola]